MIREVVENVREANDVIKSTTSIESRIKNYFKKKGYEVSALVNYHNDNELIVDIYSSDDQNEPSFRYESTYDNNSPSKIFNLVMKSM